MLDFIGKICRGTFWITLIASIAAISLIAYILGVIITVIQVLFSPHKNYDLEGCTVLGANVCRATVGFFNGCGRFLLGTLAIAATFTIMLLIRKLIAKMTTNTGICMIANLALDTGVCFGIHALYPHNVLMLILAIICALFHLMLAYEDISVYSPAK